MIDLTENATRLLQHLKSCKFKAGQGLPPETLGTAMGSETAGNEAARELVLNGLLFRDKHGNLSVSPSGVSRMREI